MPVWEAEEERETEKFEEEGEYCYVNTREVWAENFIQTCHHDRFIIYPDDEEETKYSN